MKKLYQNKFQILIGDNQPIDYSDNVLFPIKWSNLLDEQLDEASITLVNTSTSIIKPLTKVQINLWNESAPEDIRTLFFIVSGDSAEELPIGSGKYKHLLTLIEETKYLERFIVRSHSYVNSLGRDYLKNPSFVMPEISLKDDWSGSIPAPSNNQYVTPMQYGVSFNFPNFSDIFNKTTFYKGSAKCIIYEDGNIIKDYDAPYSVLAEQANASDFSFEKELTGQNYTIKYSISESTTNSLGIVQYSYELDATYTFFVTSDIEPVTKWNARTVIERVLTIAETLNESETPRFTLNEAQAEEFEKIETPEFSFTQSTLREVLQDIGKYIHGEPRLRGGVIYYDMYGSDEKNTVEIDSYASNTFSQTVEQYSTQLVSNVDNLVNSLDYVRGAITEPFGEYGYKTLRTETLYARIEDGNAVIRTEYPIYAVTSLIWSGNSQNGNTEVDITPYVFESTEYERLSAYGSAYPNSRQYALYYTQGEKDIKGLWFKQEKAWAQAYGDYAITAILKSASGVSNLNFNAVNSSSKTASTYPSLAFQITYVPIYSALVRQNKSYIGEFDKPSSLAYNQGQNLIESSYYGENLKGVLARMGNIEKNITFVKWGMPVLPKVGTLYDDDYYISTMSVEYQPYTTKVILGLSKDFNRLSQFIGINSLKRFYEISERQSVESHIAYTDYCIIGDAVSGGGDQLYSLSAITGALSGTVNRITAVKVQGYDKNGVELNPVVLPVQCASFGNSVLLTAKAEDNYSAGQQAVEGITDSVVGYWANGTAYKDIYGNMETVSLSYKPYFNQSNENRYLLPSATGISDPTNDSYIETKADKRLLVKIGSTEVPTIDYQIDTVTNRQNLIIGSAFSKRNSFVASTASDLVRLYVLPYRLSKFAKEIDLTNATLISSNITYTINEVTGQIFFDKKEAFPNLSGNSWALVSGNELLLGENRTITENEEDIFRGLVITAKHNIF